MQKIRTKMPFLHRDTCKWESVMFNHMRAPFQTTYAIPIMAYQNS